MLIYQIFSGIYTCIFLEITIYLGYYAWKYGFLEVVKKRIYLITHVSIPRNMHYDEDRSGIMRELRKLYEIYSM